MFYFYIVARHRHNKSIPITQESLFLCFGDNIQQFLFYISASNLPLQIFLTYIFFAIHTLFSITKREKNKQILIFSSSNVFVVCTFVVRLVHTKPKCLHLYLNLPQLQTFEKSFYTLQKLYSIPSHNLLTFQFLQFRIR